jgi:two-component system, chemotaxis family, sensor kinase CheA
MLEVRVPDELMARFRTVAMERLERIDNAWSTLVRGEGTSDAEKNLLRDVHTLKGDARVVGLPEASLLCQRLEDLLAAAKSKGWSVHEDVDIVVTMTIQFVAMLVRKRVVGGGIDLYGFLKQIEEVMAEWLRRSSEAPDRRMSVGPHLRVKDHGQRVTVSSGLRLSSSAVGVYLESLRQTGDARARIRDVWVSLYGGVEEAHRAPIQPIVLGQVVTVKSLAYDLGKRVAVDVDGDGAHAGPETADVLGVFLLHALRNAIDHGIETPEVRLRAGKPESGTVRVRIVRDGDRITLSVADDGAGVDIERVRARAVERGLLSAEVAPHARDEEVLDCLFAAGLSTRDSASEISGRGIGLDAAHATVVQHGGNVRLESRPGKSTTAVATVPDVRSCMDVAVFEGAYAPVRFAVPASTSIRQSHIRRVEEATTLSLEDLFRIPRERSGPVTALELVTGTSRIVVPALDRPVDRVAFRKCVTPESDIVEVVWVDGSEVLLVRPEHLHGRH